MRAGVALAALALLAAALPAGASARNVFTREDDGGANPVSLEGRLARDRAAPLVSKAAAVRAAGYGGAASWSSPSLRASGGGIGPVRAFIASAVVPGLGQLLQGSRWGYANLTLEAVGWVGYLHYHHKGLDGEDAYAAYAAKYYHRDQYQAVVDDIYAEYQGGLCDPAGTGPREACQDIDSYFTLDENSKSDHFIEDIGKLDKYIFGWEDWGDTDGDRRSDYDPSTVSFSAWGGPGDAWPSGFPPFESQYRAVYQDMRRSANANHDRAARFSWILVVNRVVSAFHAAYLARDRASSEEAKMTLRVDPDPGADGVRVAWARRF